MSNPLQTFGTALFGKINLFIFAAIWIFVPLAAADAVSRERREGTLALLYLTPLRAFGIVLGKGFVHILRSASLFLTMAPALMLPLLFGGVEIRDIRMALIIDSTAVLLALAAGLLASTFPRDWLKSVILAELFGAVLLLLMLHVHGGLVESAVKAAISSPAGRSAPGWGSYVPDFSGRSESGMIARTIRLVEVTSNGSFRAPEHWFILSRGGGGLGSDWQGMWSILTPAGIDAWFRGVIAMLIGGVLVLLAALWLGAWAVARSWRDAPDRVMVSEARRRLFMPQFGARILNRCLARALTANPIGWLQNYSPSARLVKWAWCLFVIGVECLFSANPDDLYAAQGGLGLLLLLGLTFSATASFRGELETGAFELLLVTPLRERQIIVGRLRGLWRQFFPAFLVYGAGSIYLVTGWNDQAMASRAWLALVGTAAAFFALPLIGLYFSVRRWNFFTAWAMAALLGLLPAALGRTFGVDAFPLLIFQIGVGLLAGIFLERRLRRREFLQAGS